MTDADRQPDALPLAQRFASISRRNAEQLLDLYETLTLLPASIEPQSGDIKKLTQNQTAAKAVLLHLHLLQRLLPSMEGMKPPAIANDNNIDAAQLADMMREARQHAQSPESEEAVNADG